MSGSRLRPYLGPVIALLVVLALGAGTVYAAIPNGSGTYYACYVKNTGAVKLINYPKVKTCKAGEKLINWNAKGPAGRRPVGPQGPVGPAGPQGPAGAAGITKITVTTYTSPLLSVANDGVLTSRDYACPTGKFMGGGYYNGGGMDVLGSFPLNATTWRVWARNSEFTALPLTMWINCMTTDPGTVIAKLSPAAKKAMATASKGAGSKKGN